MMRSCCIEEVRHFGVHWLSSALILGGCIYHMMGIAEAEEEGSERYPLFTFYVWLSIGLDVVSHTIKEAIVRSQPLNQESFNFQLGLFQMILGCLLFPIIKIT